MPLTAEYTWVESETTIQVQVPLKGHSKSKLDVFATECYLKVSFPPYLLEVDLDGCIDSVQPRARVDNGTLIIKAKKKEGSNGLWGSLGQIVDRKSTVEAKARREESIKEKFKQEQELKERVSLRKHQDERLALRSQMSLEEDERRRIEDIKAEEKENAEAEIYRAFAEMAAKQSREESASSDEVPAPANAQPKDAGGGREHRQQRQLTQPRNVDCTPRHHLDTIDEGISEEGSPIPTAIASGATAAAKVDYESSIWEEETGGSDGGDGERDLHREAEEFSGSSQNADASNKRGEEQEERGDVDAAQPQTVDNADDADTPMSFTPAPRTSAGVVQVGFTTRLFPTPLRESKVADESAWIMKNRRHLHKNKSLVGRLPAAKQGLRGAEELPLDISESDPVWLKGRGDDLYRGGDFLAAVNAYTAALDADPQAAACLSNRAACYLRLSGAGKGNGRGSSGQEYASACVADCGAAFGILQTLPETGPSQGRALARRSLAYRELGQYCCSLEDCRAALVFNPGDAQLLDEIARGEPLAKGERCKKEAATRFASGDIVGACEMYTAALAAVPSLPSALSNRAACYLALGKPRECVRDCTAVLEMLSAPVSGQGPSFSSSDGSGSTQDATCVKTDDRNEGEPQSSCTTTAAVDAAPRASAPSSSPPFPPPPVGSMPPPGSEKRTKWVLATLVRRARANVQLEDLGGAIRDYRTANSVRPGDKAVEEDIRELELRASEVQKPLVG